MDELVGKPELSEKCSWQRNALKFDFSYGYDSKKPFNLCALDKDTVAFATGCYSHFLNCKTGKLTSRRCFSSGGIGHMTTFQPESLLAVGESGNDPPIIVYSWPSMSVVQILKNGAEKSFSFLCFNDSGKLLASQATAPDFMLNIWTWRKGEVLIRAKSHEQGALYVTFSPYNADQLVTCGPSHIKFWQMSESFTGLKLLGELGKFGKTEACDIMGAQPLPTGDVISGSTWGNLLLWSDKVIELEVYRTGRRPCHNAPISQVLYCNQAITTICRQGHVRLWNYETIDMADPSETDPSIEMEPLFETLIGDKSAKKEILYIVKRDPNPKDTIWFAQDGEGAIFQFDLNTEEIPNPTKQIYETHGGAIKGVEASHSTQHFATLGADGKLVIYQYVQKAAVASYNFPSAGSALLWLPKNLAANALVLAAGFETGVVRLVWFLQKRLKINLVQVIKPHKSTVTSFATTTEDKKLVSASADGTFFFYHVDEKLNSIELTPIGYCEVNEKINFVTFKSANELLVACESGSIFNFNTSNFPSFDNSSSYLRKLHFESINFPTLNEQLWERKSRLINVRESTKIITQGGEETDAVLKGSESVFESPSGPFPALCIWPSSYGSVWISFGGLYGGGFYEYNFQTQTVVKYVDIPITNGTPICKLLHCSEVDSLILGLQDGRIVLIKLPTDSSSDKLNDYWSLGVHDCNRGQISGISRSFDTSLLFTCALDGSIFSHSFLNRPISKALAISDPLKENSMENVDDSTLLSIEELRIKSFLDNKSDIASEKKSRILKKIIKLETVFKSIKQGNSSLPAHLRIQDEDLVSNQLVLTDHLQTLQKEIELDEFKMAQKNERYELRYKKIFNYLMADLETFDTRVSSITLSNSFVETFRLGKVDRQFMETMNIVERKLLEIDSRGRIEDEGKVMETVLEEEIEPLSNVEALVQQLVMLWPECEGNLHLSRVIKQHRSRRAAAAEERRQIQELQKLKPVTNSLSLEDEEALRKGRNSIGRIMLRTSSPNYLPPSQAIPTTLGKYQELLLTKLKIYNLKREYNEKVLALRNKKQSIIAKRLKDKKMLARIRQESPQQFKKMAIEDLPPVNRNLEFPEKILTLDESKFHPKINLSRSPIIGPYCIRRGRICNKYYEILHAKEDTSWKTIFTPDFTELEPEEFKKLLSLKVNEDEQTPWEKELIEIIGDRMQEQNLLKFRLQRDIEDFDNEIQKLKEEKINVEYDAKFLQLHLLRLNQEILILKTFESSENQKSQVAFEALREWHKLQKTMNEITLQVDGRAKEIHKAEDAIKAQNTKFLMEISDNKFFKVLRRIYMKKYRPPKIKTEDSDETESESESESELESEEEETKTADSLTVNIARYDESINPPGCDPEIFAETFRQRTARHELELYINERRKQIEVLKKEYDKSAISMKQLEEEHARAQKELDVVHKEKQEKISEIDTFVELKMDQIQSFRDGELLDKLNESIVMSAENITKLYLRVNELKSEAKIEKEKHIINKQHLSRMSNDINFMKEQTQLTQKEIEGRMIEKFGFRVNLEELEEALVKKLIAEMYFIPLELETRLNRKLKDNHKNLFDLKNAYKSVLEENTDIRHSIKNFQHEQNAIKLIMKKRTLRRNEYIEDPEIKQLESYAREMEHKISELKREIEGLKAKTRPVSSEGKSPVKTRIKFLNFTIDVTKDVFEMISNIVDEANNILEDMTEGFISDFGSMRLKKLFQDVIKLIPTAAATKLLNEANLTMKDIDSTERLDELDLYEIKQLFQILSTIVNG